MRVMSIFCADVTNNYEKYLSYTSHTKRTSSCHPMNQTSIVYTHDNQIPLIYNISTSPCALAHQAYQFVQAGAPLEDLVAYEITVEVETAVTLFVAATGVMVEVVVLPGAVTVLKMVKVD